MSSLWQKRNYRPFFPRRTAKSVVAVTSSSMSSLLGKPQLSSCSSESDMEVTFDDASSNFGPGSSQPERNNSSRDSANGETRKSFAIRILQDETIGRMFNLRLKSKVVYCIYYWSIKKMAGSLENVSFARSLCDQLWHVSSSSCEFELHKCVLYE